MTVSFKPGALVIALQRVEGGPFWKTADINDTSRHRAVAEGEVFVVLSCDEQANQLHVVDSAGLVGYVPTAQGRENSNWMQVS
jgi:hypothetical protein